MRATRALIHLEHLKENIGMVREKTGRKICMPVKADAYGHGALAVARAALAAGVSYLAVATVREGEELREGGIGAPVLLLSVILPGEVARSVAADLEPLAGDAEYVEALDAEARRAGKRLPVHLKIDTGMGRIGCRPREAAELAALISGKKNLRLAGTATHLAVSDSTNEDDIRYTGKQLDIFNEALETIRAGGMDPGIVHAANTGAVTFHGNSWFNMVRPGILLYGYPPYREGAPAMPVKPLMELVSSVVFIKSLQTGEPVSYGRTWAAGEDTVIGTLPLGYGDGLPRGISNNWQVLAGGELRPLVGRICMDQCMVDLGRHSSVKRWDQVTVFGGAAPHAGDLAARLGTIPYEITCNINKRVPRVYTGGESTE
jgi:alanine racemase